VDQLRLSAVLAEFARTLVGAFSIQEILDRFVGRVADVLPADGAGVLLFDDHADMRFVATTDEQIMVVQHLQIELGEGPCLLCYRSGEAVAAGDLATEQRFPHFAARAIEAGLGAVHSFPLRLDGRALGALDLYSREAQALTDEEMTAGQILADVAAAYVFNAQARADATASAAALRYRAMHDALTNLPNRMLFEDRLGQALTKSRRTGARIGVLFLDVDRFKAINDTFGHPVGDRLLIALGDRVTSALRPGDTLARIAGDEFLVLCEDITDLEHAEQIAARLLAALQAPFALPPNSIFTTISIGIAVSANHGERAADLLVHADSALYEAKRRGGGRAASATRRARDRADRRLGEVPAPAIVASAERTGLVRELGAWVVRHACEQQRRWRDAQVAVRCMCVNVAGSEFTDPAYYDTIADICDATDVDPGSLCLEITESVLIDDVPGAMNAFDGLKRIGVQLALDDFGTGYCSLSYLKRFPVDMVKIDQSFVADVGSQGLDEAIVTAVVTLAHHVGICVVAEGVENRGQRQAIAALGCDMAQGYHFGRPLPAGDVAAHLFA
jgi:diguanylate cyclase (GGDEF)-like protein